MQPLRTAERYYATSAALAARAARRAWGATTVGAAVLTVQQHQAAQASQVSAAGTAMLAEQGIVERPTAVVNALAFTTATDTLAQMLDTDVRWEFDRIVAALVQDAGRTAQSVDMASRAHVQHVRHLTPPSCSRCAVLAGRVYRYSEGFQRHPGCDCVMVPVTVASPDLIYDPAQMAKDGQVTGLSKADMRALDDGADFNQIVNARLRKGGVRDSGEILRRGDRLTPAGIYARAGSREEAVDLLRRYGYLH